MVYSVLPKDGGGIIPPATVYERSNNTFPALAAVGTATDTFGNLYASAGFGRLVATIVTQNSAAFTASGNSGDQAVGPYDEMSVDINITANSGTSQTIQFFVDRKGSDNVYYPIWQSSSITTTNQAVSTSIGPGCAVAQSLGATIHLRWVIGGTSPSYTFSFSLQGK